MNRLKNLLRQIPLFRLGVQSARKFLSFSSKGNSTIPTMPYQFSKKDAKLVYEVVLSQKLHHKMGKEVESLEDEFASYNHTKYALATNSGTSALEMALKAIEIKPGDEVIVPAYTFVATAQAVLSRGGIPVFADIDDTFTIDPDSLPKCLSPRTKAIIAVHMFGNVADMDRVMNIAKAKHLFVIEDACQAAGALYKNRHVGSIGDIGCFSFDIKKAIFTGQGGMFITSNKKYFEIALRTRETGQLHDEAGSDVITTGNTYALTEMQAVLARSILKQLDFLNSKRTKNYELFSELIDANYLPLRWYRILPNAKPSFPRLVFMIDFQKLGITRKTFLDNIREKGVPLKTFYPVPLYRYSLFRNRKDALTQNAFPFSLNKYVKYRGLSLPFVELFCKQQVGMEFSPYLSYDNVRHLTTTLREQILSYYGS